MTPDEGFDLMHGSGMLDRVRALVNDLAPCSRRDEWWSTDGPYEIIARHFHYAMGSKPEIVGRNIAVYFAEEAVALDVPDAPSNMSGILPPDHPNWGKILDEQCESALSKRLHEKAVEGANSWMDRCKPSTAAGSEASNAASQDSRGRSPVPSADGSQPTPSTSVSPSPFAGTRNPLVGK